MDPRARMHLEGAYEALENGSVLQVCDEMTDQ